MSLSISDLFTAQTADQIRASMVSNLVSLGIPADQWRKGGVFSTILTVAAMAIALLSAIVASLIQGFFLPTATGNSLKLLAKYMYGVTVPTATFASGSVTLTNSGGFNYPIAIGGLVVQNPTTKVTYTNDAAFTLAPGATLTGINVVAQGVAGSAGNAAPGAINTLVTSLVGVTVTNPAALVGVDAPTDPAIRQLCLNKLGAMGVRGVRTAYAYAVQTAVNAVTGAPVNINRWSISSASHSSQVTVIVAAPSGVPDPNDVLGVATNIEAIARPEAITVTVSGATAVADTDTLTFWCSLPAGVTAAAAKAAIDAALVTFFSGYAIGGATVNDDAHPSLTFTGLTASAVYGVAAQAVGALGGVLLSAQGGNDLALTAGQVATDSVTTTVRVIAPSTGTTVV